MNIDEKIADLEKQLAEAKKQKELENGIWKPKKDDEYYLLDGVGCSIFRYSMNNAYDDAFIRCGNFYKTREEAEYQANVQKYTNLFRKYVEKHSDKLDWDNGCQEKHYIYYHYNDDREIYFDTFNVTKVQGAIYASSNQILQNAVNFVGKENVIKYVLGVEK